MVSSHNWPGSIRHDRVTTVSSEEKSFDIPAQPSIESMRSRWFGTSTTDSDTKIRSVENLAFATANIQQRPSRWTKSLFQLYLCLCVPYLTSCINGYNGTVFAQVNAYPQYRSYFNLDTSLGTPTTGIAYAIYPLGTFIGSWFAGPASDWWGRKWGMFQGALVVGLFAIIEAESQNFSMFLASRFFHGFGMAIVLSGAVVYLSEIAHPSYRGMMTGAFNIFWYTGALPATMIPWATSTIQGTESWRIPLWCQTFFPLLVAVTSPFLPETPRWLIANGRNKEALEIMVKYHGDGNQQSPLVKLEYEEMLADISTDSADKRWWDYRTLFNNRENRYRSMLVISTGFVCQLTGNGAVSYYYPAMLATAGITSLNTQLLYNGFQVIISMAGAILGAYLTDKIGRRKQFFTATIIIIMLFVIVLPLNATNLYTNADGEIAAKSIPQAKAIIAMIFLFGFVYSASYSPLAFLYPVECLRYESRAKGMGMHTAIDNISTFYNEFVTGIAFTEISWKYYYVYIFWNIATLTFMYFFYVETKGRTLEEMGEIFRSKYPVKTSKTKCRIIVRGEQIVHHETDRLVD